MSEKETSQNRKPAASTDGGKQELQEIYDKANEQGFFGVTTDPTPNENYTLTGQGKGLPTPETDGAQADEVAAYQRKLAREGKV